MRITSITVSRNPTRKLILSLPPTAQTITSTTHIHTHTHTHFFLSAEPQISRDLGCLFSSIPLLYRSLFIYLLQYESPNRTGQDRTGQLSTYRNRIVSYCVSEISKKKKNCASHLGKKINGFFMHFVYRWILREEFFRVFCFLFFFLL